jgi:nitrite reductase/ring-hydroxylating ferredoxin subunit
MTVFDVWPSPSERRSQRPLDRLYRLEDDGGVYAIDNVCTHALAYLSEGWLEGDVIECPLHGGCFNVRTGKGLGDPIEEDLKTYPIQVSGS